MAEDRAKLSSGARSDLPDSAFAHIEPGHEKEKVNGKTPDKYRHFPVHDAAHARNALARIGQGARFGAQARAKVLAAAKKFGVQHDDSSDTGRSLESLFPEVRFVSDRPELRYAEGADGSPEKRHITGYASMFGKVSRRLGGFHEKVESSAFNEALRSLGDDGQNVFCRYNHKADMLLGTTLAGTLQLAVDERGLKYDVVPPEHRSDVMELVDRGDVRYSSFAFRVPEPGTDDSWSESEYGLPMRSLHKVELVDVAPVLDPAYHDTTAVARNIAGAVESLASWVDADPTEVRSILEAGQASRFFRRTDRPSTPKLDRPAADAREETRVLDDPAVALRRWSYAPEQEMDDQWTSPDQRVAPDEEELRAAMKTLPYSKLCQKYIHGEPCVLPAGHDADGDDDDDSGKDTDNDNDGTKSGHKPLCYARKNALPCHKPMDHAGDHEPLTVSQRDGEEAGEVEPEHREAESDGGLNAVDALRWLTERRKTLTQLDDDE